MNAKVLVWLSAILALLVALAMFGQRQTNPVALDTRAVFLPGLLDELDSVDEIEIAGGGNEPVARLGRAAGGWVVEQKSGYPADLTKVRHMLLTLAEARILERKTANPELHERLGVEDIDDPEAAGLRVTLTGPGGPVGVVIGDEAGEYRRYARRNGEAQAYLIDRDPEVSAEAADWLDTALVDIAGDRVREVTVTHPDGEALRAFKAAADQANFTVEAVPENRLLLYDGVANVMGNVLQNLLLEDVRARREDEGEYTYTEFRTFDGLVLTARSIEVGDEAWVSFSAETDTETAGEDDPSEIDVTAEARELNDRLGGWSYRIPSYKLEQLTRRMADLLQAQS